MAFHTWAITSPHKQNSGPVLDEEIRDSMRAGEITPTRLVAKEGDTEWTTLRKPA